MEPSKLVSRYNKQCNVYDGPIDDSIDDSCCRICPAPGVLDPSNDGFSLDSNGCPEVDLTSFKSFVSECPFGTTSVDKVNTICDGSCYDYLRDAQHCGLSCTQCDPEPAPLSTPNALAKSFCMDAVCIEKPLDHCCGTGSECGYATSGWTTGQMRILPSTGDPNINQFSGQIQYSSDVDMKVHYESGGTFRAYISLSGATGIVSTTKFRFGRHCTINGREATNSFCENPLALSENDCTKLGSVWRTVFSTTADARELRTDYIYSGNAVLSFPYFVHPNELPFGKGEAKFDCIVSDEVSNFQLSGAGLTINGGFKVRGQLNDDDTTFLDCLSSSSSDCSLQSTMQSSLPTVASSTALTPWLDATLCSASSDNPNPNYEVCGVDGGDGSSCESGDPVKATCADVQPDIDTCTPEPAGTNCCEGAPVDGGGGRSVLGGRVRGQVSGRDGCNRWILDLVKRVLVSKDEFKLNAGGRNSQEIK